jgi:glycosyltransferase involved in cell wall biosynthesis
MVKVSVVIKTLNEQSNISRAIESAIEAVTPYRGEVIVADSGSTDRTIETAMRFPVLIVQLSHPRERRCGIGPQLGYQHSTGEYVYILDGDMEIKADFLREAIEFLDRERTVAGVGGIVNEMRFKNLEFEIRARHFRERQVEDGSDVDCLTGGGLYRRSAVEEVGYISDRNLHGFEEYDLGVRLRAKGWRLVRLERHAVDHYSYTMNTYRLLWYRIRAGRLLAFGEVLRAAIKGNYLKSAVVELRPIRFALGMLAYWALTLSLAVAIGDIWWAVPFLVLAFILPILGMAVRNGSLTGGGYSVAVWHLAAINLLLGLVRTRAQPNEPIESRVLRMPPDATVVSG